MINLYDELQKISIIVSVPVPVLLSVPIIVAVFFHAVRVLTHKKAPVERSKKEINNYLNKKNKFAAVFSIAFIIISAYFTYTAFTGETVEISKIEKMGLRR